MRADGRGPRELRPVSFKLGVQKWAEGSCLIRWATPRSCARRRSPTASRRTSAARARAGSPPSTRCCRGRPASARDRESAKGRIGGRTHEIQRLIGRSLRGVVDLGRLGERTITVDCDVLQADGGTRTASITGGYVALAAALITYGMDRLLVGKVAAVSVGIVDGLPLLDLDYSEDSRAEVDFNVVGTDGGTYVELQGTAEGKPFDRAAANGMLDLADAGLARLFEAQAASPRHRPPVSPAAACSSPPARRTSCASCGSCSTWNMASSSRSTTSASRASRSRTVRRSRRTPRSRPGSAARATGLPTLADDSGLEVDALDGGPGVRTRRYAGEDATDADNNAKLLAALEGLPPERRGARYVCVLALPLPGDPGPRGGVAADLHPRHVPRPDRHRPAGDGGFGYDPIFEPAASRRAAGPWGCGRRPRSTPSRIGPGPPGG